MLELNAQQADKMIDLGQSYLRPVSSLSKKWITTVLNTKLEKMVKRPAIPGRKCINKELQLKTVTFYMLPVSCKYAGVETISHLECIWTPVVLSSGTENICRQWLYNEWWSGWWCHCLEFPVSNKVTENIKKYTIKTCSKLSTAFTVR